MRVALISDIHGNLVSLDAVLADIRQRDVDRIVCLGDVAAIGPQPREVLARLKSLGCPCVTGNHETSLLDLASGRKLPPGSNRLTVEWEEWSAAQLTEDDFAFLRSFQPVVQVALDDAATLLCCHGSPRSNRDFILASTPDSELNDMLTGYTATVLACGHTHVQMVRRHRSSAIVNVGSVGCPFERIPFQDAPYFLPWSEYATIHYAQGNLNIGLHRVPMDLGLIKEVALSSTMPHADTWADYWLTAG